MEWWTTTNVFPRIFVLVYVINSDSNSMHIFVCVEDQTAGKNASRCKGNIRIVYLRTTSGMENIVGYRLSFFYLLQIQFYRYWCTNSHIFLYSIKPDVGVLHQKYIGLDCVIHVDYHYFILSWYVRLPSDVVIIICIP